ncbi:MAG: hypothetical protein HY912_14255 [Desulfomonile tiedjei]|uniref:Uncharacterized protein n=1 Tax=Desulfomonile tiedjei TaxID=2358 RepID=A0A9D6Z462_9BACT|nr:hypothetical protein [Desulfomonile tiedjei]
MKARDKTKPDYKKFIKKPAPLTFSPPSEDRGVLSGSAARKIVSPSVGEADIPWAEIILDKEPGPRRMAEHVSADQYEMSISDQPPPLALFGIAMLGLVVLLYFSA